MGKQIQKLKEVAKKNRPGRKRPVAREIKPGSYDIGDVEHFREFFSEFALQLKIGDLVLFAGVVGAGKTEGVRSIVETLGGRWVSSPSFAIHQRYAVRIGFIDHVDLYRLESDEDLESTGFWDLLDSTDAILAVEWADRLPLSVWPKNRRVWKLMLKKTGEFTRQIEIT